jgi:hypothetical protein
VKFPKTSHIATAFAIMMFSASPAFAANSAKIQVSATILPFVNFNAARHFATFQVNSDDLKRGYVDLPNAITVNVLTNISGTVTVIVDNWGGGKVLIKESGTRNFREGLFNLSTAGYRTNLPISKNYDSRIVLPNDAREGVYPFEITMTPSI